jgi:hypothetical protein
VSTFDLRYPITEVISHTGVHYLTINLTLSPCSRKLVMTKIVFKIINEPILRSRDFWKILFVL